MRLTSANVAKILELNEGMKTTTSFSGKHETTYNYYKVEGGSLYWRRYHDSDWTELDYLMTQSFIRRHVNRFILPED